MVQHHIFYLFLFFPAPHYKSILNRFSISSWKLGGSRNSSPGHKVLQSVI